MSSEPLVSVCIPSYNHARFLSAAIESVLAQTYHNYEVIIVDDGSTDGSLEIAQRYAAEYPKIKVYTHPNNANCGISRTANAAIEKIKGEYWTACCSDDIWYPDKIETEVNYMEENPNTALVYGYMDTIDAGGESLPECLGKSIADEPDQLESLLKYNPITAPSMMARRDALMKVGLHEEGLTYSDWEMWIRFASFYKIGFIAKTFVKYRVHHYNSSIGIDPLLHIKHLREMYQVLSKKSQNTDTKLGEEKYRRIIAEQLKTIPAMESRAHLDNYYRAMATKDLKTATASLKKAFNISPSTVLTPRRIVSLLKRAAMGLTNSKANLQKAERN